MAYLKLLRPKHWAKNLFLFIPLFLSGQLFEFEKIFQLVLGFLSVSLIASSVYILNDYRDIESDKLHPEKCKRPLAAGTAKVSVSFILFGACLLVGFGTAYFVNLKFFALLFVYFALNLGYSFGLKNISILDLILISIGFSLRVKMGGVIANLPITEWLNIMIFLLAMFLAIAKRTDDLRIKNDSGVSLRKSIAGYSNDLLNVFLAIVSAVIILSYMLYTQSEHVMQKFQTYRLYYTSLFVIAGLFRYLQIVYVKKDSGSPTKVLYKDPFIQVVILMWILSFYLIIYVPDFEIFK